MKNIKSTDPRKADIVKAIKLKSGANKVTLVKEDKEGTFQGHAMKLKPGSKAYDSLGFFTVTPLECGLSVAVSSLAEPSGDVRDQE